eukprot:660548_1
MNLYHNHSFVNKIMRGCGATSMEKWKSMIDVKVISNETLHFALEIINNATHCDASKVRVLIMNSELFSKLLRMDQERSLLIMETVKFGNKMLPVTLNEWIFTQNHKKRNVTWFQVLWNCRTRKLWNKTKIFI